MRILCIKRQSPMSKKSDKDHKKNLKKVSEEEFKKKKKFDDDPIVKKYTTDYSHSKTPENKRADVEYKRRKTEEEQRRAQDEQRRRSPIVHDYTSRRFNSNILDDEQFKTKKHVDGIVDEMFSKRETSPFSNVQYADHSKRIQHGNQKHANHDEHKSKKKEHKSHKKLSESNKKKKDSNDGKLLSLKVVISKIVFLNDYFLNLNLQN